MATAPQQQLDTAPLVAPKPKRVLVTKAVHGLKVSHAVYGPGSVRHAYDRESVAVYFFDQRQELMVAARELQLRDEEVDAERTVLLPTDRNRTRTIGSIFPGGGPTPQEWVVPLSALERRGKVDRFILGLFRELGRVPAQGFNDRGDPIAAQEINIAGFRKSDYVILENAVGDESAKRGWQYRRPRRPKRRVEAPAWAFNNKQLQMLYRRLLTGGRGKDRETDARQAMVACYMFYRMGISAAEVGKELGGLTRERVEKVIYNVTTRGNKMFPTDPTLQNQ